MIWDYKGQLDENNLACGIGFAVIGKPDDPNYSTYEGTFIHDKMEGIGTKV